MAERHVNVRFPAAQLERLDVLCAARGVSRSDVIRGLVMDAVLTPAERASIPTEGELLRLLADKARAGNVAAIRTLLGRAPKEPGASELDELDRFAEFDHSRDTAISRIARRRTANGTRS